MLSRLTHCTFRSSIIAFATVVLPEADPPQMPSQETLTINFVSELRRSVKDLGYTNDNSFCKLPLGVVPRWTTCSVYDFLPGVN